MSNDWHDIWLSDPEEHDFPAAQDFLELQFEVDTAEFIVGNLKLATTITKKAKDILRASWLTALPEDNIHVRKNLAKFKSGKKLSPVLLVRYDQLIIADGYHRVCAAYYLTEDLTVPCRLVSTFPEYT